MGNNTPQRQGIKLKTMPTIGEQCKIRSIAAIG